MILPIKWLFVLSLIFSVQIVVLADDYDIINALSDVASFFPSPVVVFRRAMQIWQVYQKVKQLLGTPNQSTDNKRLDKLLSNMEQLSLNVYKVQESLQSQLMTLLPKEIELDSKLKDIYEHTGKINYSFHLFLLYSSTSIRHENETIKKFYDVVTDLSDSGMRAHLSEIYRLVMQVDAGSDVIATLADHKQSEHLRCKREQSSLQLINNLYNTIILAEVKAMIMTHYAYNLYRLPNDTISFRTELKEYIVDAWERLTLLIPKFKSYMDVADRDIWKCDPHRHIKGSTYIELSTIFNIVALKEAAFGYSKKDDAGRIWPSMGEGTCEDRKKGYEYQCVGIVRDCRNTNDRDVDICLEESGSDRRYKYVELKDTKKLYGNKISCSNLKNLKGTKWGSMFEAFDICWCTCEEDKTDVTRYFSLRAVTSNIDENKVITGVKFVEKNMLIQLQIQQGRLHENGNIAQGSVDWKPLESIMLSDKTLVDGKDYHKVTYDTRRVNIDSLEAPANCTLTGLKFVIEEGVIKLAIQYVPIDFRTGKLTKDGVKWHTIPSDDKERPQIEFRNDLPLDRINMPMVNEQKAWINFTTSSIESDLGSSVVPFIDSQEITSTPAVLLSGTGLVYKGANYSAGFITLKLQTYNYADHLQTGDRKTLDKFLENYDKMLYNKYKHRDHDEEHS